jgi:hypothetical protein
MQVEKTRFIERKDFRVRKMGTTYCPHFPAQFDSGIFKIFKENEDKGGVGFEEVLETQYLNLLLNGGEKNTPKCPYNSEINALPSDDVFQNICRQCTFYLFNKGSIVHK